jgi:Zn-dependent protease
MQQQQPMPKKWKLARNSGTITRKVPLCDTKRKGCFPVQRFYKSPLILLVLILLAFGPLQALITEGIPGITSWIMDTMLLLPAIIIALSFHEFAHAKMADLSGDPTPRSMGRVTIDPKAHIDPLGMIALIFIHFGWGKPVVINPDNFRNRKRDSILVGLSGVTVNLILAVLFGGIIFLIGRLTPDFFYGDFGHILGYMLIEIVIINVTIMLFNLLPIPPLDGFGVLADLFNLHGTGFYRTVYQNSMVILMVAIILDIPSMLLSTPLVYIVNFIMSGIYNVPDWWYLLA